MMKSREHLVNKTLETKVMLMEKKSQEKQMCWELLQEDEKMKADIDERRARAEEKMCHGGAHRRGEQGNDDGFIKDG
jgi:hypothetical protein